MKRKGIWALAAVLACGALVQLVISATASSQPYSEKELGGFRERIRAQRQMLEDWINGKPGSLEGIVEEKAIAIDLQEKIVVQGRTNIEEKWRSLRKRYGMRRIKFDTGDSKIEIIPARFIAHVSGADWVSFDSVAIDFVSFTFAPEPEARGGPSYAQPEEGGRLCFIWDHRENCPQLIGTQIGN